MGVKRVMLMYISDVSGHRSAALAIEKALKIRYPGIEVYNINAFNYTNPVSEKIVNRIYMGIIKQAPGIWDYLYDNPSVVKKITKIKETIHKYNGPKIKSLFDEFKPDAVVCTQAYPCGMVADYKKSYGADFPLIAVLTDYIPHSYWVYDSVDLYITPSIEVSAQLIKKGILSQRIRELGIPFDPEFNAAVVRKDVFRKYGLKEGVFTILIMGGGQGLGPIKTIVKKLEKVTAPLQEIVVTGTNNKLFTWLEKKAGKCRKKLVALGYVNNINELMDISDIIITKPGGITTAEALSKKLPLIIIKPIPGQEVSNAVYLTEKSAAIRVDSPEAIETVIEDILKQPEILSRMRQAAGAISKPRASLDIAELLLNL